MKAFLLLSSCLIVSSVQSFSTKLNNSNKNGHVKTPLLLFSMKQSNSSIMKADEELDMVNIKTKICGRRSALSKLIQSSAATSTLIGGSIITSTIPQRANAIPDSTDITSPTSNTLTTTTNTSTPPTNKNNKIEQRITADNLLLPPPSRASELSGIDNLYYPSWLEGEWYATQTLINTSTPLGLKFVGGPNGSESIALESVKEQRKQLDIPVKLKLRYIKTKFGVAEDRLFNTKQRLDSFAGRSVVSSVEYADVGGSNRGSVLMMGGTKDDPLQTTVVRFKGPAAQKSFLISHGEDVKADKCGNTFAAYEVIRSIFALTNTNTAPPVTTDTELIWSFVKIDDDTIDAKLRIASYLNAQSDKLYFEAKNQAVSFADYELKLTKN